MTEHTPGPWIAIDRCTLAVEGGPSDWAVNRYSNGYRSYVATLFDCQLAPEHGGTVEANARLIAAAPDLLEACEAIAALADGQGRLNMLQVAGQARQAIAKTTGKDA